MTPGEVVRIRVNPQDAMSVADIVRVTGFNYTGLSFSAACSIALSALLETMREQGRIPRRDGFEYSEIMAPFGLKNRSKRKYEITRALATAGDELRVPAIPQATLELTYDQKRAKLRMDELYIRKEANGEFSLEEETEWTKLVPVYMGEVSWDNAFPELKQV